MSKINKYLNKNIALKLVVYAVVIGLFWVKMNYIQANIFSLNVENANEANILAFNPLSSIFLIFGIGVLLGGRRGMFVSYILGSILLYVNVLFYREYNDFITIPMLNQVANLADLGGSITTIMSPGDALLFADVLIAAFLLFYLKPSRFQVFKPKRREGIILAIVAIPLFLINLQWAETERTDLLERTFDRNMLVKYIGVINYHVYDAVLQGKTEMKKTMADSNELVPVINYMNENKSEDSDRLEGVAEGKNVIVMSMESTQTFVVDNTLHGEELTPYFNDLKEEGIYFDNFYHQVKQGRTSDSEFLLANSLYPLNRGAVFFTHSGNQYEGLPSLLNEKGYFTSSMHANDKTFWNRNVMYDSLGFDEFYSKEDYDVTPEKSHGWGYLDEYFFEDSLSKMKEMDQPFYTKMITLTNHYPFTLPEEQKLIEEGETGSGTLNRYFQTIRYQDEALKKFVEDFKNSELYDDTILVIYGDHFGISENHQKAMGEYLDKDINEFEQFQLQRVPLLIYGKGIKGEKNHTVGGQIDLRPTLTNLLGIEDDNPIQFGHDLLDEDRRQLMITRDGNFANEDYVGIQGTCYDRETGEKLEAGLCDEGFDKAQEELEMSDSIIYGDLLRYLDETEMVQNKDEGSNQEND
ncbi:LTA synthase family protein [Halobacillus karajensis]|uniref:Lipoteichoic acid synthase 1 n=1 Tax=Halobacillus karajensis TaxID=195088 RepID=A0A059NVH1_9BACI|nr:LTA synthase family protein [Halobacillus karajensis]CDQ18599.1 Lipoteichoic acid synthase 1 [Halobacillus karajensis]CDQ23329.1 Lipoteichoic acid synthase 1 [Halobacillus karajensis]CDQ26811.1 Lipoteichoic acid synthase 1 [Halobacillus karajensis]